MIPANPASYKKPGCGKIGDAESNKADGLFHVELRLSKGKGVAG
jgi:hypothetical protein